MWTAQDPTAPDGSAAHEAAESPAFEAEEQRQGDDDPEPKRHPRRRRKRGGKKHRKAPPAPNFALAAKRLQALNQRSVAP